MGKSWFNITKNWIMLWCLWRIWSLAQHSIKVISYFSMHYIPNIHLQYALYINILQNTRITDQYQPFLAPPLCNIIMSTIEVITVVSPAGTIPKTRDTSVPLVVWPLHSPSFLCQSPTIDHSLSWRFQGFYAGSLRCFGLQSCTFTRGQNVWSYLLHHFCSLSLQTIILVKKSTFAVWNIV